MSSSSSRPTRIRQVAPPPYRFEAVPCGARSPPKRGREHTAVCGRCHHLRRRSDLDGQESVRYGWDLMARLLPNVCPSDDFSNYLEVYLRNAGRTELISALHHSLFRHARSHPPPRTIARCTRCLVPLADNVPRRRSCGAVCPCVRGAGGDGHRERPPTISSNKMTKADPRDLFAKHSNTVLLGGARTTHARSTRAARTSAQCTRAHACGRTRTDWGAKARTATTAHARSIRAG